MTQCYVKKLTISHFRNYESIRLETDARPVVIIGENGAGKTNILEAISLLSAGRGIRRASPSEWLNLHSKNHWGIAAEVEGIKGYATISTGIVDESEKRIVKIDGKIAKSQTELGKIVSLLWLTPQMDNLFIEGNTERRKFLDRLVFSFDPAHATRINGYENLMRQRNAILFERSYDATWLDSIEHKMAEYAEQIDTARADTITRLNEAMQFSSLAFPKALMAQQSDYTQDFTQILKSNRNKDQAAGRTLNGVHRTTLTVKHLGNGMLAELCSTGEQKALLISIILAHARAGKQWSGITPVMLLDEIASHLDRQRRTALYEEIILLGVQAWITSTDKELFEGFVAHYVQVKNNLII